MFLWGNFQVDSVTIDLDWRFFPRLNLAILMEGLFYSKCISSWMCINTDYLLFKNKGVFNSANLKCN